MNPASPIFQRIFSRPFPYVGEPLLLQLAALQGGGG